MVDLRRLGLLAPLAATCCNLLLAYAVYFLARVVYLLVNYSYFSQGLTYSHLLEMFGGGLVFDTSAILVTNIPYVVMMLFPSISRDSLLPEALSYRIPHHQWLGAGH